MNKKIRPSLLVQYLSFGSASLLPWYFVFSGYNLEAGLDHFLLPFILFGAIGIFASLWDVFVQERR